MNHMFFFRPFMPKTVFIQNVAYETTFAMSFAEIFIMGWDFSVLLKKLQNLRTTDLSLMQIQSNLEKI